MLSKLIHTMLRVARSFLVPPDIAFSPKAANLFRTFLIVENGYSIDNQQALGKVDGMFHFPACDVHLQIFLPTVLPLYPFQHISIVGIIL